ncbi:MAG TPA: hypothetical protein VGX27_05455 [Candidatus Dormibacteraeota bacterium]|nr:hypothetical protein [Candidatus Dormibacteraeota bacterium]
MSRLRTVDAAIAAGLAVVAGTVVLAFVLNSPTLDRFPDTASYEAIADHLPSSFVSSERLPGYPLVIAFASILPGGRNAGLLVLQSLMAVGTVVLTFFIGRAALGSRWMALVPAFLVATDLLMAGFARVAMSETQAVLLTTAIAAATVAFVQTPKSTHLWLLTGLMIAALLTRPEWAFLAFVLLPYMGLIMARRGLLSRSLLTRGAASAAAVVVCVGGYSIANLAVNDYLGMSSVVNVALLGKVMVYNMEGEAPPPYDALAPKVTAIGTAQGPWALTDVPPFDDRNHQLEGEFARAVILHDPIHFAEHVLGTLLGSSTAYDAVFIRIQDPGTFSRQLEALLILSEVRYRAFVIVLALAVAWSVLGLAVPPAAQRPQLLGALGVIVLYGAVTAAAGTFDEFGRVHMPINPISTVLIAGTLLLNAAVLLQRRLGPALLSLAAIVAEVAAILLLPGRGSSLTLFALAAVALLQVAASWSSFTTGSRAADRQMPVPSAIH